MMLKVANLAGEVLHINLGELLSSLPAERQNLYATGFCVLPCFSVCCFVFFDRDSFQWGNFQLFVKPLKKVQALKRKIQSLTGIPILKQRLLIGSNFLGFRSPVNELQDAEITMVLQDYGPSSEAVYNEALQGDVPGVMGKLDNSPQDPDATYLGISWIFSF